MFLGDSRQAIGTFKETVFSLPPGFAFSDASASFRIRFEFVSESLGLWFGLLLFLLWPFGCGFVWFGWLILLSVWLVEIGFGRLGSARLSFA